MKCLTVTVFTILSTPSNALNTIYESLLCSISGWRVLDYR